MDEQLIQAAAQSFCKVPEVYQQIFKQAGQDFPDELVQQIKQQPEQAMQMLEQNQDLLKNVVTIYSQYQDQINQAMQQNSMFKEGGKFDYLVKKMQNGGKETSKVRTDGVNGMAYSKVFPDGTKVLRLTRDHVGAQGSRYSDDTQMTITPSRDTTVNIGTIGTDTFSDFFGKNYHTKTDVENRKRLAPILSRIFPWRTIPDNVVPAFKRNGLID